MANVVIDKADLGSGYNGNTTGTIAFTTTQAVASGGFIVIGGGWFADDTITVSSISGGGLTWTVDKNVSVASAGFVSPWIASAQAPSGLASGTTITATLSANAAARFIMGLSFTNVATSTPVDGTPVGPTFADAVTTWATASYAISAGSVIVAISMQSGVSANNAPTSPSIEGPENDQAGDTLSCVMEYRIESSGGSYTVAGTWNTSVSHTENVAVAYLAAAGGGAAQVPYQPNYLLAPMLAQ